jgi:signal transduction histidine kinase
MAASLAHEIRNPLAALELSATLLGRRLGTEGKEGELLATLQEQIRRLSRTVNASLEFVRPLALDRTPNDLVALLEEALEAAAVPEGAARIEVVRRFPAHRLPVAVDALRLREAFLNLIRNALEAMAERGGALRLIVEHPLPGTETLPGASATVLVGDSGPGISEGVREKIFNPFFSTKSQGSGLGLAWTRKVVDAHGGTLDVDSRPGHGALFSIRLPLPAAANASDLLTTGELLHEAQDSGRRG